MKRNPVNVKITRYAPRLQHIFHCDLKTRSGQKKWARFFGWEKGMGFPDRQPK
jgi:hypothetical protein